MRPTLLYSLSMVLALAANAGNLFVYRDRFDSIIRSVVRDVEVLVLPLYAAIFFSSIFVSFMLLCLVLTKVGIIEPRSLPVFLVNGGVFILSRLLLATIFVSASVLLIVYGSFVISAVMFGVFAVLFWTFVKINPRLPKIQD